MSPRRPVFIVLAFTAGIAAASAGFHLKRLAAGGAGESAAVAAPARSTPAADASILGKRRADFRLPDPDGVERGPADYEGKVLVVNFWATWCPPCLEEMPIFMKLQERYASRGLQFLGVAIDEADNVRSFVAEMRLNYPTVYGQQAAMDVATAYGNRIGALPYTAVVDRDGRLMHGHTGALDEAGAVALIEAALAR